MTLTSSLIYDTAPVKTVGEVFIMSKCKYRRRGDVRCERYVVYMPWKGKTLQRTYFQEGLSIVCKEMAERLCHEINGDYQRNPKSFDPRKWFNIKLNELRYELYAPKWLSRRDMEESSRAQYKTVIDETKEQFYGLDIREIKKAHLEDYKHRLIENNLAPVTIRCRISVLKALFRDAFNDELIDRIPGIPRVKVPEPETRSLSRDQQDTIIGHIPERDRPIFAFMRLWGLRVSEAIALQWDAVDFEGGWIHIKRTISGEQLRESRKSGDRLPLPMTEEAEAILKPLRGLAGYVFRNAAGRRYKRQTMRLILNRACDKAGVERVTIHGFSRHSWAVQKINKGISIEVIQAALGHKNRATTERYAKFKKEALKEIRNGM